MRAYHCTTPKKFERYKTTGAILPPVRFWSTEYSARKWMKKTGRSILLVFDISERVFPLPVKGGAFWTDQMIRNYQIHFENDFYS